MKTIFNFVFMRGGPLTPWTNQYGGLSLRKPYLICPKWKASAPMRLASLPNLQVTISGLP